MSKVVHIITGLNDGGAEAVLYRLCLAAEQHDRHVVISLSPAGKYSPLLEAAGVEVHHLDMPRGRLTVSGLLRLFRLLRHHRPDVVQTWMYHADLLGGVVARLAGCRRVFWNIRHSELVPGATGRSTLIVARLCAFLSRLVPHGIVACAERAREVHIGIGYDAGRFVVIPNGYDVSRYRPDIAARAALRDELGIGPETPLLGLVGRWNKQKDHPNLLAAFARVAQEQPGIRLLLVGTGCTPDNSDLVALIEGHHLAGQVLLAGRRDDIPAVMNGLDLHILSSSHGEGFPNVVAEAMACGTPCIVTDVGDAALIVGQTGWVVPPRDPEALAEAMRAALGAMQDDATWHDRKDSARRRIADNFSLSTMVERYQALWQDAPVAESRNHSSRI